MTIYSFKYSQQDAKLYSILYYCQCSTCFRRFLRLSSGAQKLKTVHTASGMCQACLLLPLEVGESKLGVCKETLHTFFTVVEVL